MKTNVLAREFSNALGFKIINDLLEGPCIDQLNPSSPQIAYNTICTIWILSYHPFAHKYFEDYGIGIIEKVSKIMDFFSWEKITRIMLMLFDNLKANAIC